jgi:signal transduction histidine kinase
VSFLAITIVPATALGWLSWRILEQDRALESQRVRDRLEHSADVVVAVLDRRLLEMEDQLAAPGQALLVGVPGDVLIASLSADRIDVRPSGRLLYSPVPTSRVREPPTDVFKAGEELEFRGEDYPRAIAAFRELSRSRDSLIRAGALVRLARNLRKNSQYDEALAAYDELARLGAVPVGGVPAELLAREARCARLADVKQTPQLQHEAAALYADLAHGRWDLDRASYLFHSAQARSWLAAEPDSAAETQTSVALSDAVEWLWAEWQRMRRDEGGLRGRRSLWVGDGPVLLVWRGSRDSLTALVAGPRSLESRLSQAWADEGVAVALSDADGHTVLGQADGAGAKYAVRRAADTRLPWTLRVSSANPGAEFALLAGRRRLLLSGLALTALLTILGGYFTARATARELAVARLQSDFVSAVSHEFRTPLTSLRHLTELLAGGTVAGEDRRRQYYLVMARETERLHRLVEGLLDFGRMEAGETQYRFEGVDPVELVESVVADFQTDIGSAGRRVELATNGLEPRSSIMNVDRESISRAIRNLLDNAVKYSPEECAVRVELARDGQRVAVRVRDDGVGIPATEHARIFEKFVRGSASQALHVKGTGIGLAMVQHIVHAHGGEIRLQSEPGRGSTFSLLLPAESNDQRGTRD